MKDPNAVAARLIASKERIEQFAADRTVWAQVLSAAVLDLLRSQQEITADDIRAAIEARTKSPIEIMGTTVSVEFSRKASDAAIKHLDEAVGKREREDG